ncbi:hypothetical protein M2352_003358 [Azospirillum fermentarium]|uniref:radical SAM-modified peptide, FtsH ternary system-associated n=1 Tax=Azospirillum fermentarium TaxID=1233114 RepID=UPI00222677B8|nr:radical SAM-modified peptide, FtsH ternary system-associated [Azospirillum fermentarium]MCW2247724.1 hypothetical protein [Azospirillum fermentarium]
MTEYRFKDSIPDLFHPTDYDVAENARRLRIRIRHTDDGVEIIGDALSASIIEELLEKLDPAVIEQMLCG